MSKFKHHKKIADNKRYLDLSLAFAAEMVENNDYEAAAVYAAALANFAWLNCTGYYANWQFEALLNTLGTHITNIGAEDNATHTRKNGKPNVLHIATELYETGGHTRLLFNWVKNDTTNNNKIVVTRQTINDLPQDNISSSGLDMEYFITLDENTNITGKAGQLRAIAGSYDCIVMHTHPDDVIAVIALSSTQLPPVAFLNHADHIFWLGASVADLVLQIRDANISIDKVRRKLDQQFLLPIPVPDDKIAVVYTDVRNELGIGSDKVLLLSTGTSYKYAPTEKHNFFTHIIPVLDKHPNALLYIAGVWGDSPLAIKYAHKQIVYLGVVNDLYRYETACDIYAEGFPMPSFTAMLQAGKKGKPIQLMYDPLPVIAFFSNDTQGFKYPTEEHWQKELEILVSDTNARTNRASTQQAYFKEYYDYNSWQVRMSEMFKILAGMKHNIYANTTSQYYNSDNEEYLTGLNEDKVPYPPHYKTKPIRLIYTYYRIAFTRYPFLKG